LTSLLRNGYYKAQPEIALLHRTWWQLVTGNQGENLKFNAEGAHDET